MSASVANAPMGSDEMEQVDAKKLYRKLTWHLIPYIFLLYILAYLDRVNVGFAAVEFKRDLHLTDTIFGLGGAIYFMGQFCFDLPSNLLLGKIGPRIWIARIMITWGLIATSMTFVKGAHSFVIMRFLLGVSEAGFFPGMILYLTYWFPSQERAEAVAKFMTATSLAGVVGGFIAHYLMKLDGVAGLHGWQWLFLSEGIPTLLVGFSVLWVLKDHPDDAPWLTDAEKKFLDGELERDRQEGGASAMHHLADGLKHPMIWVLAGVFALEQVGVYTLNIWMPDMLNAFVGGAGHGKPGSAAASSFVALLSTLPYLAAAICTVLVGWSSDRTGERRWHVAGCFAMAAVGFAWAAYAGSLLMVMCAMTVAAVGLWSMTGPFWAMPTRVLGGQAAAGGVAVITMVGSLGAFVGPALTGKMRDLTHNFTAGLLVVGGIAVVGAALVLVLKARETTGPARRDLMRDNR
jgi:ACS family tartrate transporter-like MFS transporter